MGLTYVITGAGRGIGKGMCIHVSEQYFHFQMSQELFPFFWFSRHVFTIRTIDSIA